MLNVVGHLGRILGASRPSDVHHLDEIESSSLTVGGSLGSLDQRFFNWWV